MSYPSVPLRELLVLHDTGVWGPEDEAEGISVLRSTNFRPDGSIRFENLTYRSIELSKRVSKRLEPNDIILEKSGGGPKQPVGRVCLFRGHHIAHAFGNFTARLRVEQTIVEPEYLFWCLRYLHLSGVTLGYQKHTSGIRNLETKRYLSHLIPLPPLDDQRRIIGILNRAAKIERLRARARALMGEFMPALFIKMFGDPVENLRGWDVALLGEVIQGFEVGKNVMAGNGTTPLRILKVSAVTSGEFDPSMSKPAPDDYVAPKRHRVRVGDLLISRANTSDHVGATAMVEREAPDVLLPDKIWRFVWQADSPIEPRFVHGVFQNRATRGVISAMASGTSSSMKNISQAKLKKLRIIVPPLERQKQYAELVETAQSALGVAESYRSNTSALQSSLMSRLLDGVA